MKTTFKKIISNILRIESQLVLWKYKPRIVAITGSVGKTSTKDAVYAVLSKMAYVRKSEKSYNSEIGLPLTILGVSNGWNDPLIWFKNILKGIWLFIWPHKYPEWLVLEVGVGKPGDMQKTALWLHTDVVIITAISSTPVHIEFFKSRDHLVEEKSALIKTLKKDGLLVLNYDDETVFNMKKDTKKRFVTYGFKSGSDVFGSNENISYLKKDKIDEPNGIIFRVDAGGNSLPVVIDGAFGKNHIYAALGALAFCYGEKLNMLTAIQGLKNYDMPPGRMRLLQGINETLIIDDTYNSSPFACEVAITTVSEVKNSGRKMVVLGDMLELGKHTEEAHIQIGKLVKKNKIDFLFTVGPRAKYIKIGAVTEGMNEKNIFEFDDSISAGKFLESFIKTGDMILIKGSQGVRMERIVETILLNKNKKSDLLVRQDKEWINKI